MSLGGSGRLSFGDTPPGILNPVDAPTKTKADKRLARIEGQVRGLRRMLAEDASCVDSLTQLAATRSALDHVGAGRAAGHVKGCILGHGGETEHDKAKPMTQDELVEELRITLSRLMR